MKISQKNIIYFQGQKTVIKKKSTLICKRYFLVGENNVKVYKNDKILMFCHENNVNKNLGGKLIGFRK